MIDWETFNGFFDSHRPPAVQLISIQFIQPSTAVLNCNFYKNTYALPRGVFLRRLIAWAKANLLRLNEFILLIKVK